MNEIQSLASTVPLWAWLLLISISSLVMGAAMTVPFAWRNAWSAYFLWSGMSFFMLSMTAGLANGRLYMMMPIAFGGTGIGLVGAVITDRRNTGAGK